MTAGRLGPAAATLAFVATYAATPVEGASAESLVTCHGREATVVGTVNGDLLVGTPGDDVVVLGAGDDVFDGLGGDDIVCGEEGRDLLVGGPGDDLLDGGPGNDRMRGDLTSAAGDVVGDGGQRRHHRR